MGHNWKALYILYRDLVRRYQSLHSEPYIGIQVLRDALNVHRSTYRTIIKNCFGLEDYVTEDWDKIEEFRNEDIFEKLGFQGVTPEYPAESPYQTAIQIMQRDFETQKDAQGEQQLFFRGQRRHDWLVTPSFFRGVSSEVDFQSKLEHIRRIVRALQDAGLGSTELEALAIAQHYSRELNVRTWLVDVTASPFVALFFATEGGTVGDTGTVNYISRVEWKRFNGEDGSRPGSLRYVSLQGIPRIANQMGFFLESPHPELYRQLVPYALFFQQDGEVFEDETLTPPVTYAHIYPDPDPTLSQLPKSSISVTAPPLQWEPPYSIAEVPDALTYMEVVKSAIDMINDDHVALLTDICRLHVQVIAHSDKLDDRLTHLHRLTAVSTLALRLGIDDLQEFLDFAYFQYLRTLEQRQCFAECVAKAVPAWKDTAEYLASKRFG